jgi:hypothetical protein
MLYNILVGKQPSSVKADAKTFVEKIGFDQVGYVSGRPARGAGYSSAHPILIVLL